MCSLLGLKTSSSLYPLTVETLFLLSSLRALNPFAVFGFDWQRELCYLCLFPELVCHIDTCMELDLSLFLCQASVGSLWEMSHLFFCNNHLRVIIIFLIFSCRETEACRNLALSSIVYLVSDGVGLKLLSQFRTPCP